MYWTWSLCNQYQNGSYVFSKACKNNVGQANVSRKISNTIESLVKPSEDRQFLFADGEYNIKRLSRRTTDAHTVISLESSLSCLKIWVRS